MVWADMVLGMLACTLVGKVLGMLACKASDMLVCTLVLGSIPLEELAQTFGQAACLTFPLQAYQTFEPVAAAYQRVAPAQIFERVHHMDRGTALDMVLGMLALDSKNPLLPHQRSPTWPIG